MPITPEQAQAELARRELARRELARRELAKRGVSAEEKKTIPAPKTALENFTYPIRNAYSIQQEEAKEGIESMKKAVTDPGVKNTLMGGLGALQYFFSPVTGIAKGIVGEPIEGAVKGMGVPDKGAEFIGSLAENASYFASPGAAIKSAMAMKAAPGLKAGRKITQATVEQFNKAKPAFTIKRAEDAAPAVNSEGTRLGVVQEWGTENQYLSLNPYHAELKKQAKSGKPIDGQLAKRADRWEMEQVLNDKPAYLNDGIGLSSDDVKAFAEKNGLVYGERNGTAVVAKDRERLDAVINAQDQRSLGLALGYRDIRKAAASAGNPAASILMQPQLKESVVKQVVDATRASLDTLQFDKSKRLFRNITEFLKTGELAVEDIPQILKAERIAPEEFARLWADTISLAGRDLNHLSRLSKDMKFVFRDNKVASSAFDRTYNEYKQGQATWELIGDGFARLEDFRRGLLVTQLATTMRNISSQAGRLILAQFDEALQSTIKTGAKAIGLTDEASNGINIFNAFHSRLSKEGRMRFDRILDAEKAATHRARLITQSVHEVPGAGSAADATVGRLAHMGQKVSYALNILNRTQEHFFRKIAFEAKLKQELANAGIDYAKVSPDAIPEGAFKKALDYALEMTFSGSPKTTTGRDFINAWRKLGLTTVNPFPRFAFANALPFMIEHSPLGYFNALSPEAIKGITSGNPEVFAKAISRATLGTLMLKSAWHFRQSEYAGERWYQIKLSEDPKTKEAKYMDIRAFAPFSTYFFLAEAMQHPERMSGKDYFEAAIGLNRTAGTGLVVIDLLRSKKTETTAKLMQNFVNAYVSSFTVPLRTPKDLIAGFDPEEAKLRDTKDDPKWGPLAGAMGNIPYVSQQFPEAVNPLSTRVKESETPILRQTTGVSITTKNAIEREVDRLGIDWASVYPKTGFPGADREISRKMSQVLDVAAPLMINESWYKHLYDDEKKLALKLLIEDAKNKATDYYKMENSDMGLKITYQKIDSDVKAIIERKYKNNPVIGKLKAK